MFISLTNDVSEIYSIFRKCKQQRVTGKVKPITSTFTINGHQLQTTVIERDLGVCVASNLTWKVQVYQQASKANKMLGYIRRNTTFVTSTAARRTLYLALVRSHYSYSSDHRFGHRKLLNL